MKYILGLLTVLIFIFSCNDAGVNTSQVVNNKEELKKAIDEAEAGDNIVLANGSWENVEIRITKSGTASKPITLSAETPGKVLIQGASDLKIGADHIIVEGLHFVNGYSPSNAVIEFAIDEDHVANHSVLRNCVIEDYNKSQRNKSDLWVLFKGRHNEMAKCYLTGKSNRGPTVRVDLEGNRNIKNFHKIINNHFGPRPPKGGPSAETLQIGNSFTSMSPSYTMVNDNLFDRCNGEVEVISSKTNFNEFRNNVFYKSEGSLVTRHGNYCTVDGNYFIGDEKSDNIGGVRLIGTGHTVTNNYFYKLRGKEFRSPLAVMNGIPKSPLNRYIQVTDVVVAHNSWIDCSAPWHFGVGSNVSQKDVLPASEIRSARPKRTVVANNLIYNTVGDKTPVMAHDKLDGIKFKSNLINNQGTAFESLEGLEEKSFALDEVAPNILVPGNDFPDVEGFEGFEFDKFAKDLFGASREKANSIGAIVGQPTAAPPILDKSKYGTDWYNIEKIDPKSENQTVTSSQDLAAAIAKAKSGDMIELEDGNYEIPSSLKIDKTLTIKASKSGGKVMLTYRGEANTPLFEMNPKGQLTLKGLSLFGNNGQFAFASLKENMSSLYNLTVEGCEIENFNYILKAYKYSFAEHLIFKGSSFKNCRNGLELSEEVEDKGEYNAENITIADCKFLSIEENVLDYYRGGYDESTVGGNYNRVKLIAQLWGAKNNSHSNNEVSNSGRINVEENLKLNLLY